MDIAAKMGNIKVLEALLEKTKEPFFHSRESSLMCQAASQGKLDMIKFLVDWGGDINNKCCRFIYLSPLQAAAFNGEVEVVRYLLSRDAIWKEKEEDKSALMLAASKGHFEIVKMLDGVGAINNQYWSLYSKRFPEWINIEVVNFFVERLSPSKSDINVAFLHAVGKANVALANYFMDLSADLNCSDTLPPLCISACVNEVELMDAIITKGGDVNCRSDFQSTPLHYAVQYRQMKAAQLLLERNCDINVKDFKGYTPLHMAVVANSPEMTLLLVEKGADLEVKSEAGQTALELVNERSMEVGMILVVAGADLNKSLFAPKAMLEGDIDEMPEISESKWWIAWKSAIFRGDEKMAIWLKNHKYLPSAQQAC